MTEQADIIPASQVTTDHETLFFGEWRAIDRIDHAEDGAIEIRFKPSGVMFHHPKFLLPVRPKQQKPDTLFDRLRALAERQRRWNHHIEHDVIEQLDVIATYIAEHREELMEPFSDIFDMFRPKDELLQRFDRFVEALLGPRHD